MWKAVLLRIDEDISKDFFENAIFLPEANAVSVRWRIIVSHESIMGEYSGKGISFSSVFVFVCCMFLNQNFRAA